MATITGLTAGRMLAIEAASVVDGDVVGGNLILTRHDGSQIYAGSVAGPPGPAGPAGSSAIPGEVKMWAGSVLPDSRYGTWVWADGNAHPISAHPIAAANIASVWRTFGGVADPGAGSFRVPDLRGLTPVGMDAMPGGPRAGRMIRAVAITLAGRSGEETHIVTIGEMPAHNHPLSDPGHHHQLLYVTPGGANGALTQGSAGDSLYYKEIADPSGLPLVQDSGTGISIQQAGGGNAHENVQPTVFVPYIVFLDG